jgi:hypothetical protein
MFALSVFVLIMPSFFRAIAEKKVFPVAIAIWNLLATESSPSLTCGELVPAFLPRMKRPGSAVAESILKLGAVQVRAALSVGKPLESANMTLVLVRAALAANTAEVDQTAIRLAVPLPVGIDPLVTGKQTSALLSFL